ncbi:putative kinetoplast DNA-associated protein [Leishmania major strain Friedlin]|uniref:Putative kinetoplast DNA-associated protein n=1 Tax=Leishmania major TaxID=5664 RepID=Q4Q4P4_LEIMA|nr:putative kinetoplast DNA-associated protein [Leishmania major strain Friedlin]CAG9580528.1 kinetoplast-associated_protein_3_-_putative [Leishmania major strain Friedlin]CAJ08909.1 putative kinetoplast DNA-associated protein [Leishmania major strain Friedlin]|eukprot:XP_001685704.1 putative kinetoplast DNA-associated protein [Leishmania major strain Friedlin]
MLRRSFTLRRVSPFSLFQKHLGETGVLKGIKNPAKKSAQMYSKLSTPERKMFEERARRVTYPALDAYNRFQKEYAPRFLHLPMKQRQRKVAQLWAELKKNGTVKIPKNAKRKIRKVAKKTKPRVSMSKTAKKQSAK